MGVVGWAPLSWYWLGWHSFTEVGSAATDSAGFGPAWFGWAWLEQNRLTLPGLAWLGSTGLVSASLG